MELHHSESDQLHRQEDSIQNIQTLPCQDLMPNSSLLGFRYRSSCSVHGKPSLAPASETPGLWWHLEHLLLLTRRCPALLEASNTPKTQRG
jgi:hypothetical protein